jgi:hypothetical protein
LPKFYIKNWERKGKKKKKPLAPIHFFSLFFKFFFLGNFFLPVNEVFSKEKR